MLCIAVTVAMRTPPSATLPPTIFDFFASAMFTALELGMADTDMSGLSQLRVRLLVVGVADGIAVQGADENDVDLAEPAAAPAASRAACRSIWRAKLHADAKRVGGVRLLPGRFMVIEQAMGVPQGRSAAQAWLSGFIEEMKATGFVAAALQRHGIEGAAVAPAR